MDEARAAIYLGIAANERAWRVWDLGDKCVVTSRDVVFDEDKFPSKEKPTQQLTFILPPREEVEESETPPQVEKEADGGGANNEESIDDVVEVSPIEAATTSTPSSLPLALTRERREVRPPSKYNDYATVAVGETDKEGAAFCFATKGDDEHAKSLMEPPPKDSSRACYEHVESLLVPASAATSSSPSSSPSSPSRPSSPTSSAPSPPIGTFGSSPQSPLSEVCGGPGDRDWSADLAGDFAASTSSGYRVASRLVLHQFVLPPIAPPNIFKRCLRALLRESTRDVLAIFQEEAARIRRNKGKEDAEEKGKAGKSSKLGAMFLHKEALGGKKSVFGAGKGVFGLKGRAQRKAA
ncbi:unnamed protein product [Closterium sp. Naga37s-1]|nr:unnamed protein product [Closterium sp. Naga37s-1]